MTEQPKPAELRITNITFYLPMEAKKKFKRFVDSQGVSISWVMRNFIDNVLREEDKKKEKNKE